MKKYISLIFLTALSGLLTSCGVKGPLYFPADNNQQEQQPTNQIQPK